MESDADEPRDENTGLSAFDDLDQVSTVSTLEKIPEAASAPDRAPSHSPASAPARVPAPPPRGHSVPPPVRASVPPGGLPAVPRGSSPRSVPPPSAPTGRASVPPPVPPGATPLPAAPAPVQAPAHEPVAANFGAPAAASTRSVSEHDDTRVLPTEVPFADPHEAATRSYALEGTDASAYDSAAEPEEGQGDDEVDTQAEEAELRSERFTEPEPATAVMSAARIHDDGLLELSATTAAHEPPGTASEAEPVTDVGFVVNAPVAEPAPVQAFSPPVRRQGDFEDDAVTNVLRADQPITLPTPVQRGPTPTSEIEWPAAPRRFAPVVWGILIVIAAVGVGLGIRTLVAKPDPGMATLVTTPIDARVSLDGRPLVGQTSPFSMQGLAPDVEHHIEVTRDGFVPQETAFRVNQGEVKLLSPIELKSTHIETGFSIDSMPTASTVFVDEVRQAQLTPMRRADLTPGRHGIRLEREGYKPWEMHLILAEAQMVELPQVTLMQLDGTPAPAAVPEAAPSKPAPTPVAAVAQTSKPKRPRSGGHVASVRPAAVAMAPAAAPAPDTAPAGGGMGGLRVNSRPWSQVYVDGRLIGNTPQMNIPLPAGKHQLDLVNPQMGMKKSLAVKIKAGETLTKVVNLVE